jgi:hypothetical protein
MNSGLFGEGNLSLGFESVEGLAGLQPRLVLKGKLIGKGYGIGAVVQLTADVTAWNLAIGSHALLGATLPRPYVLNWVKQRQWSQDNPAPPDQTIWDVQLNLPLDSSVIEGLEERRQGKDFSLQIDVHVLMIDRGISIQAHSEDTQLYYQVHPTMDWQQDLQITQAMWGAVLQRWERGASISLVVPLPEASPAESRGDIVRHLRVARQKIDGADYSGSIAESRKALELMRTISPAQQPLPSSPRDRDPRQRLHAIIDAVYSFASADPHTDPVIKDYVPSRSDAVATAACAAALAQDVFALLKQT